MLLETCLQSDSKVQSYSRLGFVIGPIMLQRFFMRLILAAVLGVITTVGIVVLCSLQSKPTVEKSDTVKIGNNDWFITSVKGFGIERLRFSDNTFMNIQSVPRRRQVFLPIKQSEYELPDWIDLPPDDNKPYSITSEWMGAGWPVICVRSWKNIEFLKTTERELAWKKGFLIKKSLLPLSHPFKDKVIPSDLIFSGLMKNILFWSACWLVPIFCIVAIKTAWRTKKNRCVNCGYDLRGSISDKCPECGRAISNARLNT